MYSSARLKSESVPVKSFVSTVRALLVCGSGMYWGLRIAAPTGLIMLEGIMFPAKGARTADTPLGQLSAAVHGRVESGLKIVRPASKKSPPRSAAVGSAYCTE